MLLYFTKEEWLGNIRGDLLAGIVVALALIPEAIALLGRKKVTSVTVVTKRTKHPYM